MVRCGSKNADHSSFFGFRRTNEGNRRISRALELEARKALTRNLWIIRHGEAETISHGQTDFDRHLSEKGAKDWLSIKSSFDVLSNRPSWIWASPANRARETGELLSTAYQATLVLERSLYLANKYEIIDCLRSTPAQEFNVALIAHNPGISDLANALSRTTSYCSLNLNPWGVAHFNYTGHWTHVSEGSLPPPKLYDLDHFN